ncbi:MAG: PA2778 family cysteine peptidase, partial [Pseudomonadales bacterium]|nr:PA2778 family cysteine peptidase [Pseudomonadales bacterium]
VLRRFLPVLRRLLPVLLLCTASCAGLQPGRPLTDHPVEILTVPFHPQTTDQCGPAALTSVLQFSGVEVTFEQIRERVYVPDRQGSLQLELLAASRGEDRLPVRVPTTALEIITLLESGRPVLVMQNLGVAFLPLWHFAVVVGYLPESDRFVLRSGTDSRRLMSRRAFEASWSRAERWGIALFAANEPVQGVDLLAYLDEAAALESLGKHTLAQQAFLRATETWPRAALPQIGLGNSYYGGGQLESARLAYTQALALDPGSLIARNNLAHVLGESGCPGRALALLDAAPGTGTGVVPEQRLAETRSEIESALAESGDRCHLPVE